MGDRTRLIGGLVALGVVLVVTLPSEPTTATSDLSPWCLVCGAWGTADLILNLLLFVPLGAFVARPGAGFRSVAAALVVGAVLSGAVESIQLTVPGRHATVADLVANSAGAAAGGLLTATARSWLHPGSLAAGRLAAGWGIFCGALFLGTSVLFSPAVDSVPYRTEWAPALDQFATFPGDVLGARSGESALEPGRRTGGEARVLMANLRRNEALTATVRFGAPTPSLAPVIRLVDEERRDLFILGQDGSDLVYRLRRQADDLRLRRPEHRARDILAGTSSGDTLVLRARPAGPSYPEGSLCLEADASRRCGLGHRVGRGWALLAYFDLAPAVARGLDAAWIGALFFPLGFWLRPGWGWRLGLAAAGGGLLAAPAFGPLLAAGWAEAVGAAAGLAAGVAAGLLLRAAQSSPSSP